MPSDDLRPDPRERLKAVLPETEDGYRTMLDLVGQAADEIQRLRKALYGCAANTNDLTRDLAASRARVAEIEAALTAIVAEADHNPFNPIGHVIEHVVPGARAALAPAAQADAASKEPK